MKYSYAELAGMIDHALLHPTMTDSEAAEGCLLAAAYEVASVCVKPYFVSQAADLLRESSVLVSCVVGFPAGNQEIATKRFETKLACEQGAAEVDMVINIGKALAFERAYLEDEIGQVCAEAHSHGSKVKVIIETDYLPSQEVKIAVCETVGLTRADWIKTSTGFGFNKRSQGGYDYVGATVEDLKLMRQFTPERIQLKASGGVRDLDGLMLVRDLGCTRLGTSATQGILDEYRRRQAAGLTSAEQGQIGGGGY